MKELIANKIKNLDQVNLDLGCGLRKRDNYLGVDILNYEGVDFVGDIFEILSCFPEESVDNIFSHHFAEHINDLSKLISEFNRVLKKGGKVVTIVPHFSNPYYFSDYTHKTFFGLYTFSYLVNSRLFKRKVPNYKTENSLELVNIKLHFKSAFYYNYLQRRFLLGFIFNISNFMKEIYECSFSKVFSCYEMEIEIIKN